VTTNIDETPDPDTAGQLDDPATIVLVGQERYLDDMAPGGRFLIGTWLDDACCRRLTFRGWFAGEESFHFSANQDDFSVIARPFLNVTDEQAAQQDTQLVAFPERATGSISVSAESNMAGGDVAITQPIWRKYGGRVDFLYGYRYMRMDESLRISNTSVSLDDDFAPIGSVLSIDDSFEIDNNFHGGQVGFESLYREGCWSMRSLMKFGFGSLQRRLSLAGSTLTSVDGATSIVEEGLLVRSTNAGSTKDQTFGWVPELEFTLGWHRFPRFDVTLGYHVIWMTDALQTGGVIDPDLAVNLADPPTGAQRPARAARYSTFDLQSIKLGLTYRY
jgi:hypothetical protein